MSLGSALSIATGGLANINTQFAVLSQNVANASTPGYATEVSSQQAETIDGIGLGVRSLPATLQIDQALAATVLNQNATVAGLQTTQTSLQALDSVLGTPGSGNDIGSLLGKLQDGFTTLMADPSNQTQQDAVVQNATTLAQGLNNLSAGYASQRQAAQNGLVAAVATLNSNLGQIGELNNQIIDLQSLNLSTADLQNQRNELVQQISSLVSIKSVEEPDGSLSLYTTSGLALPTNGESGTFSIANASTPAGSYYPNGGLPGIFLGSSQTVSATTSDVTNQLSGGQIGANIALRDATLPTYQAELDEFAQGLASRFSAQGLTLFSYPNGTVPSGGGSPAQSGYVGFAASIQTNPTVLGDPALVRDGTGNATAATGFTPNPAGGPASFTTLISNILGYAFGADASSGVAQPTMNTTGLGADGTLSAPFTATGSTLADFATSFVSAQAQASANTTSNETNEAALQASLNARVTAVSGVNMDTELSQMLTLQHAYGVNARVMSAVQSMFTQLLQIVQ